MATIPIEKQDPVPPSGKTSGIKSTGAPDLGEDPQPLTVPTQRGESALEPQVQQIQREQLHYAALRENERRERAAQEQKEKLQAKAQKSPRQRELEHALRMKTAEIDHRVTELKGEVTLQKGTEAENKTFVTAAATVAVGGLAWWLLGRRRKKRRRAEKAVQAQPPRNELLEQYMDLIVDEAGFDVAAGEDTAQAMRRALRRNKPVIVYAPKLNEPTTPRNSLSQVFDVASKTLVGFGVKFALDMLTQRISGQDLEDVASDS